jgi:succinate dehydrogenase / fumarate reductase, membrane anchor subunit
MSNMRDPLAQARGLGSAKDGTHHWTVQRITALALLFLVPWFIYFSVSLLGADFVSVRTTIAKPLNATLLLSFVIAMFWHARLGLQVVIEDYIHGWQEVSLQLITKLVYAISAIAAIVAIGRIVFSA